MTVLVPISWGELLDKITILEIKSERLTSPAGLANVRHELQALCEIAAEIADHEGRLAAWKAALKTVNQALWDVENQIQAKEASKSFDQEFVELARSVYRSGDCSSASSACC